MDWLYRFESDSSDLESRRNALNKLTCVGSLRFLWRIFMRRYWLCLLPIGLFLIIYFASVPVIIVLPIFFGLLLLFILFLFCRARLRITHELDEAPTIKSNPLYQESKMLSLAWSQPVAHHYQNPIIYQPREGYCGHATINNVLQSVPGCKTFIRLPASPHGITLKQMFKYWKALSARNPPLDTSIKIRSVHKWEASQTSTFKSFLEELQFLNNPNYRILCNFLRGPLFFSDPTQLGGTIRRLYSGHWSPVVAHLPHSSNTTSDSIPVTSDTTATEKEATTAISSSSTTTSTSSSSSLESTTITVKDENEEGGFVLLLDVNQTYGPFLVSAKRLFKAVQTRDLGSGLWRGLIRVELDL